MLAALKPLLFPKQCWVSLMSTAKGLTPEHLFVLHNKNQFVTVASCVLKINHSCNGTKEHPRGFSSESGLLPSFLSDRGVAATGTRRCGSQLKEGEGGRTQVLQLGGGDPVNV